MVLEGRRIAQPFLKFVAVAIDTDESDRRCPLSQMNFKKGWEESPNTKGRDAA
jgi:hypothetical protein